MSKLTFVLGIFSFSLLAFTGCSPQKPVGQVQNGKEDQQIFSNRPQKVDSVILVLKLKSPALMSAVIRNSSGIFLDPVLAEKIEKEQNQAILDLQKISPDIKVLYRYKMVLNGLAVVAPVAVANQIQKMNIVSFAESEGKFSRPIIQGQKKLQILSAESKNSLALRNSVSFIGADAVHQSGIKGQGMTVGIIDTGIDYTHSMFLGNGDPETFKSINPDLPTEHYPNAKVVGGVDLVGTAYDAASGDNKKRIPLPDVNPIDEGGHGTHVAGSVAGIGDGVQTYSGVAPEALLHAIKVFGADGSTGDAVVVAALEYAADPNLDGNIQDQLDVVNLSLGSSYGNPHILYGEAIRNLVHGGTLVVASAGNSGNFNHIVGAPSTADEAISVAASIDNTDHNWKFKAVQFENAQGQKFFTEAVEATIAKPISEAGPVVGQLVFAGLADKDFSDELKEALKGSIALIDRGAVTFSEKIRRAEEAGAIGVVVVNNQEGAAFVMGGDGKYQIPAIMISMPFGEKMKSEMKNGIVNLSFQTDQQIEKPEFIDTLTSFSSKGPRSIDSVLKPEISAPGSSIISAEMGGGTAGVKLSGTSMSAPHIAGVMALLKQAHPRLNPSELKSMLMSQAKSISDEKGKLYLLSRQGAGRVQVDKSAKASLVSETTSISLGLVNIEAKKAFHRRIKVKNISDQTVAGQLKISGSEELKLLNPVSFSIAAGATEEFSLDLLLDVSNSKEQTFEIGSFIQLVSNENEIFRLPIIAIARKISQVSADKLLVKSDSAASSAGSSVQLSLKNSGVHSASVIPMNMLGFDQRKQDAKNDPFRSRACDMQAAGYKLIEKVVDGKSNLVLQVAVKVYEPMTTWNTCEVSMLIDADGDKIADQELAGIALGNVKGLAVGAAEKLFQSVLLNATTARQIRSQFESDVAAGKKDPTEDYSSAVISVSSLMLFDHSTVIVMEAPVSQLSPNPGGQISIQLATILEDESAVEMDDFLGKSMTSWKKISLDPQSQPYLDLPEKLSVPGKQELKALFTKGEASGDLLLLYPDNRSVFSNIEKDQQLQILKPQFGF